MRRLLMLGYVFIGIQAHMFAGKDEKIITGVEKSAKKTRSYQAKPKQQVTAVLSAAAHLAKASGIPFHMSCYQTYNAQRKPGASIYSQDVPEFQLSRSKVERYLNCPTCFYLDRGKGLVDPSSFPFSLNNAVDELQKNEFDYHRENQTVHPLCKKNGLNLVPFKHPEMNAWRDALRHGLKCKVEGTNIVLQGGIDDIWVDTETKELFIVDYKATSKTKKGQKVTLDEEWQNSYKRQVEMYQVLLRAQEFVAQEGYTVSNRAYFVYSNALRHEKDATESSCIDDSAQGKASEATTSERVQDNRHFKDILEFQTDLLPYDGNADWVNPTMVAIFDCLKSANPPQDPIAQELSQKYCQQCKFFYARAAIIVETNK